MLAERFQLKAHRETKTMSSYALLPAKSGFKLKPAQTVLSNSDGSGKRTALAFAQLLDCQHNRPIVMPARI